MRRVPVFAGVFVAGAIAVAACGGGATTPTVGPVTVPSLAVPSIAIPSIAVPTVPAGVPSIAIPSQPSFSFALPSYTTNADPDLAAKFPTTLDGEPVTGLVTIHYLDIFQLSQDPTDVQKFVQTVQGFGINPATVTFGRAEGNVAGDSVNIEAIRAPGVPAAQLLSYFPQLGAVLNPENGTPTVGQTTIAGKQITTFTDPNGDVSYFYPSGEIIWTTDSTDPAELAAIFGAVQ